MHASTWKTEKRQTSKKTVGRELDALLNTRFHGAANIRGIRYQILYSLLRAFDLYAKDNKDCSIRLEGIEDVDLLGLRFGDEYVEVKSSGNSWNWSKLKEPIHSFIQVYRAEPDCRFVLAVDFPLRKDIARLAQIAFLTPKERSRVENKFRNLCRQIGASTGEAAGLASRLSIVSLPEKQIWEQLRRSVADRFGLASEAVDTYISVLVAKFLDWAKDRKMVTRADLDSVRVGTGEALAREREFQAYGRGLIDRISWKPDGNVIDFFEGKSTRPGHIAAGVDVRRATWLERIGRAISSSKICILRSSSGQGKSALLYRYAYEQWPVKNTFILRLAESPKQVELVRNYLRFRADLGLPVLLLIDNAAWHTRLWPLIAQECSALGIRVLVTVRNEDWHRFARESLMCYEILEPSLHSDEARRIFKTLQSEGRIHSSVDSPMWAYERIGEPHLLIEYVYLLTHGRMLEERLRDQMSQFSEQNEDPAKVEILRRTALADTLGAPLLADKLLQDIQLRDDPQQVVKTLSGEYVTLEHGIITGLHWVRSEHLAQILHEGHPEPASTALAILETVPTENIPVVVANALCRRDLNVDLFFDGLVEKAKSATFDIILAFLDGIFEAGERRFFEANRGLFDEAYEHIGSAGAFLLSTDFMPVVKLNTIAEMMEVLGDKGENFRKLQEIGSRVSKSWRGLDLCRDFLTKVSAYIGAEKAHASLANSGRLLDWCFLCKVQLPAWPTAREGFVTRTDVFDFPLDKFCSFTQGLYRYDKLTYRNWFSRNRDNVIGYLKLHTDCIKVEVSDSALYLEFFLDPDRVESTNEQAVSRLKKFRSAIPFCKRYQSRGIWLVPFGLKPSVDDSYKDIPQKNLLFESDIDKNVLWKKTVESHYLPDSYYRYEEAWHDLRHDALLFIQGLSRGLQRILGGRSFNFLREFERGKLLNRLAESLKRIPDPPPQTRANINKSLKEAPKWWVSSLQNFFFQTFQYIKDTSKSEIGQLAVYNFLDAVKKLPEMQQAFAQLFENVPDYFGANELNAPEVKAYTVLADLMDVWIVDPPKTPQRNILGYVRAKREQKLQDTLQRLRNAFAPLEENGISVVLPADVYVHYPIRYLPLAFSVNDPGHPEDELGVVIEALTKVKDVADFFCLVPICQGSCFLKGGYQISSKQISQFEDGHLEHWEAFVPCALPNGISSRLPPFPFRPSIRLQIRANVLALLGVLQSFVERRKRLETLKASTNCFEVELYNRCRARTHDLELQLGVVASEVKDFLKAEFPSRNNDSTYKTVLSFLEAIEEASQDGVIDDLLISADFNAEEIEQSLEDLLKQ